MKIIHSQPAGSQLIIAHIVNELNNKIAISVELLDADRHPTQVPQVRIKLTGPSSTSENIITRDEAEALHVLLKLMLDK